MSRVIALANQKGGVGKTTTCVNLAASLSIANRKVLLIDLDPQGNATMGSGVNKYQLSLTSNEVLLGEAPIERAICAENNGGYWLLGANSHLTQAEVRLLDQPQRERCLAKAITSLDDRFDFIFIDCPPSLNMLTVNALVAADGVLIPMLCEYYSLEGLSALVSTVDNIRQHANPKLRIEGILRTMYDNRSRLSQDVTAQLQSHFAAELLQTVIPRNVRLAEAPSHGVPILDYDKLSRGASAYMALAGELLKRQKKAAATTEQATKGAL